VTARLALDMPEHLAGIHLNMLALPPNAKPATTPTEAEAQYAREAQHLAAEEMGYHMIQGTRPQTLAYGLTDSPVGLAAWMIEKFRAWTDCDGDVETVLSLDRMLGLVSLYWFTGCIGASFHPYYDRRHTPHPISSPVSVPTGIAKYPKEIMHPPRSLARQSYTDIRHWSDMPRGGHFAAMEQPDLFTSDLQDFLRGVR